jgi:hypothetical protein
VGSAKGVFGLKKPKISKKCKVAFFPWTYTEITKLLLEYGGTCIFMGFRSNKLCLRNICLNNLISQTG